MYFIYRSGKFPFHISVGAEQLDTDDIKKIWKENTIKGEEGSELLRLITWRFEEGDMAPIKKAMEHGMETSLNIRGLIILYESQFGPFMKVGFRDLCKAQIRKGQKDNSKELFSEKSTEVWSEYNRSGKIPVRRKGGW